MPVELNGYIDHFSSDTIFLQHSQTATAKYRVIKSKNADPHAPNLCAFASLREIFLLLSRELIPTGGNHHEIRRREIRHCENDERRSCGRRNGDIRNHGSSAVR